MEMGYFQCLYVNRTVILAGGTLGKRHRYRSQSRVLGGRVVPLPRVYSRIRRTRNHIDVTKTGTFLEGEIRYRGRMGGVEQTSHRGDSIKISV